MFPTEEKAKIVEEITSIIDGDGNILSTELKTNTSETLTSAMHRRTGVWAKTINLMEPTEALEENFDLFVFLPAVRAYKKNYYN